MSIGIPRDIVRTIRKHAPDVSPHALPLHLANVYKPGVQLNNLAFENNIHRKLHVSTAHQSMIRVVHATLYPRPRFDVPIVSADIISVGARATFVMVDAFPTTDDLLLPEEYDYALKDLQTKYGLEPTSRRDLPTWARGICSHRCVMMDAPFDTNGVSDYIVNLCAMHLEYCKQLKPSKDHRRIRMNHLRFCRGQLKNARIRAAMSSSFDDDLITSNEYMNKVFFDC